jgi:hypothetical protein
VRHPQPAPAPKRPGRFQHRFNRKPRLSTLPG